MPAVIDSGTQTAVINTEHNLGSAVTAGKVLVLAVDAAAMQAGDTLQLRIKTKVLGGGTERVAYYQSYSDAQDTDDLIKYSVPVPATHHFQATLKQTAGTGRAFPWEIISI